jgi:hypothetical protein
MEVEGMEDDDDAEDEDDVPEWTAALTAPRANMLPRNLPMPRDSAGRDEQQKQTSNPDANIQCFIGHSQNQTATNPSVLKISWHCSRLARSVIWKIKLPRAPSHPP